MKFSEAWLREWVSPPLDAQALAEQLTMAGLEVDSVEPVCAPSEGVVVGEVLAVAPHPDADRLRVCTVTDGSAEHQVVCGAPNVAAGMKVPYAVVGAKLTDGTKIKKAKLRGVESFGMLMGASELGLEDVIDGLLELPADVSVGSAVADLLALHDVSLEVELTPNRGDCLSIRGMARETGVLNGLPVNEPDITPVPATIDATFPVTLSAPDGCPRYLGRVIKGIDAQAQTPLWMRERLRRSGLRCIDPVVDVTNYVLLELGQPMHAFDLAQLSGGIDVRYSKPGEEITLLDGSLTTIKEETLLITDGNGPVAMAGVMGGERSGVQTDTRDVFLECAYFNPLAIAGRARAHALTTDAAHRYERGVDPELQASAMERATQLLLDIVGGEAGPVVETVVESALPSRDPVSLRAARIEQILGVAVPVDTVEAVLGRLGMEIVGREGSGSDVKWTVKYPSYRFDINREIDLIEEVGRIYGYDLIPNAAPVTGLPLRKVVERHSGERRFRDRLVTLGYHEAITYSFVDPSLQQSFEPSESVETLLNPMSVDMSVMRSSILPSLVLTARDNLNRQQERIRLFELGRTFVKRNELVQELKIAGILAGSRDARGWTQAPESLDFFDAKGDVENLLALSGLAQRAAFEACTNPAFHPGQSAQIVIDGELVGFVGALHPALAQQYDIDVPLFMFELDLARISEGRLPAYIPLSRHPMVRRDIALLVDRDLPAGQVIASVQSHAGSLLIDLRLFDVYHGKGIDSNKKSIALGLTFQDPSRTLNDDEVASVMTLVTQGLAEDFGAVLR